MLVSGKIVELPICNSVISCLIELYDCISLIQMEAFHDFHDICRVMIWPYHFLSRRVIIDGAQTISNATI